MWVSCEELCADEDEDGRRDLPCRHLQVGRTWPEAEETEKTSIVQTNCVK